jgi:hypothetical protein
MSKPTKAPSTTETELPRTTRDLLASAFGQAAQAIVERAGILRVADDGLAPDAFDLACDTLFQAYGEPEPPVTDSKVFDAWLERSKYRDENRLPDRARGGPEDGRYEVTVNGSFTVLPLTPVPKPDAIVEKLAQLRATNPGAAAGLELSSRPVVNDLIQVPAERR